MQDVLAALSIDPMVLMTIFAMAGATYLTRILGYWLTSLYTPRGRLLAALEILPGATGNALWSILAGMAAVVALRLVV